MDNYVVSARKYRPVTFRSVVGQEALTTTLKNAITGNKLAHAYLFCGPRGVGKTTCARIFAKTINCLNPTPEHEACNQCESCVAFDEQRSYNIHELDAASNNSVDDIRSLIDQVRIPPQIGKYKVYIIDEVHMLSTSAFNSFLKTLEEPPAHAIFILATTEKHKIIPTILSRCQVYDFNRISVADMVNHLQYVAQKENVSAEPEALNIIAQKADGGMRDALSIFDQTVSYTAGNVTYKSVIENLNVLDFEYYFKLTDAIVAGSVVDCLLVLNDILNRGFEGQYVISGITSHFRDLLVCKDPVTATLFEVGASIREKYVATAKQCSNAFLYKAIEMANDCDLNYRMSKNKRLLLELTLIKLCQLSENSEDPKNLNPVTPSEKVHPKTKTQPVQISGTVSEPKPEIKPLPVIPGEKKSTVTTIAGLGVSLSSLTEENPEKPVEKSISLQAEPRQSNRLFTEEELQKAWQEFAENLVEEKLLRNTMMLYKPKMLGNTVFEVEVNTEINKNYLDDYGNVILAYLRESLQNDDITMTIKISEATVVKKPLTSREIFDELVQKNPSLQKLSDEFDLELS
ncbi:MAG: DNA polymerase III subunit gamma/tau [Petrimonas sp.]|jgi:DNA polymerase-3 subunit gamma/tau|uniref:DNA polymerase III subunit gamma/tau n=1 Tax=Petrimonas TaxID=307628 RepID=UPI000E86848C|nr:DNA polymerase III subunit gamma/tau [Petrimonas sp.]HBF96728.1 DNA polymerase III subunit gamma/tau [Porphyromonadaceae bacterium]MDD2911525.1 DNA polymerase III subunit gamma/tau [Petrimonas sp.]MDD3541495.1 DNA polymerase III subunit gamma/tau [Petrimonas sp.]MDD4846086.1 DNA polymerase III subunit gamma/tau [Petrimonas sp.]